MLVRVCGVPGCRCFSYTWAYPDQAQGSKLRFHSCFLVGLVSWWCVPESSLLSFFFLYNSIDMIFKRKKRLTEMVKCAG